MCPHFGGGDDSKSPSANDSRDFIADVEASDVSALFSERTRSVHCSSSRGLLSSWRVVMKKAKIQLASEKKRAVMMLIQRWYFEAI